MSTPLERRSYWWFEFSQRLFLATWPFVLASLTAFALWVTKGQVMQDERISRLEQWGPQSGKRFTESDAEMLRMRVMTDVNAGMLSRDAALQAKLESIQTSVTKMQVQLESVLSK